MTYKHNDAGCHVRDRGRGVGHGMTAGDRHER